GLGVVCNKTGGFGVDDFVIEFFGEVYPSWRWYEKQDGIKHIQNNSDDQAPEFYNIMLERPKGDRDGYDLVFVDAMHKANYASRICHSCNPNCEAKVTAVDGHYQIGIYTVRPIAEGEEITFDYNSVTESKEEHEASVCLCGSQICRGSYLNFSGEGAFEKVLMEFHGVLDRHSLLLQACEANSVSQQDLIDLGRAGLGTCLLAGLPGWLVAYTAHLVRFIFFERQKLPHEIFKHNVDEKRQFFTDINMDSEKNDAEVQAEGVLNSRLQNLTHTLDKVRYVMRCIFGDPKNAPPPLVRLTGRSLVSAIWKGEGSLVDELLESMEPHVEEDVLTDLKAKIRAHDPSGSEDIEGEIRSSLLWLRDELRTLSCTYKCRHDAAADLIHMYAYTKCFFRVRDYKTVKSPPVLISPLDLGPKYADKLGPGFQEYCKTYPENYCLGQLIYWYSQNAEPESRLTRARKGCMSLPDVSSFYVKSVKPTQERVYGSRTVRFMLARMENQAQRPWPKDRIWVFKSDPRFFGTPMMDAVLNNSPLDKEMVHWLKTRSNVFLG
ncbi:Os08g0180100, partial [Oryza sativa Japonica Group]